ncbi:MAG: M48 family metalloprotease [Acidobacteria bacterium]|nr:M48 family metalloprotease [Acidobacteriota bacterium]
MAALALSAPSAQTTITPDPNKYTPAQDVQIGREAADEARRQLPMLDDDRVDEYVEDVGEELVEAIPAELRHAGFRYTFDVVNMREINAFALPGGPMFLNRGMIEAATTEAEMAGVMAHEIAHVALRHGTAQASKAHTPAVLGTIGQIIGGVLGGTVGGVVGLGSQIGATAWITKYTREYERQADLLGAQIMARVGYDPRAMASMFQTIEQQGGRGGPEWLSSHPNPGNRAAAINQEAAMLRVQGNANTGQFASVRQRLAGMPSASTAEQVARGQARGDRRPAGTGGRAVVRVDPPARQLRPHRPASFLRVSVPANWDAVSSDDGGVTYAPEGAFFEADGRTAFTHGVQFGVAQGSGNLQRDTQQLVQSLARSNPDLRSGGSIRRDTVGGRQGLTAPLSNVSDVTGQREYVALSTTRLRDGSLLYMVGVAPQSEAGTYETAFRRVRQSLQIADR